MPEVDPRIEVAHRSLSVADLQAVAAHGWRPQELEWLGRPGEGWRLRWASGFTARANSALTVGNPGLQRQRAIDRVEAWYADRGLPARFAMVWPLDAVRRDDGARGSDLDTALIARGYRLDTPTLVQTAALSGVAATTSAVGPSPPAVVERDEPDDGWLSVYRYRGEALPPVARRVLLSAPAQVFVSIREGGQTVAVGRGASARGWTGVTAMDVLGSHRRRGLAGHVLAAIARWGVARGDHSAYLQVAEANLAARALYASVGFVSHHGYHYRLQPDP